MAHFWKLYTHELRKVGTRYLIVLIAFIVLNGVLFLMRRNTGIDVLIIPYTLLLLLFLTNAVLMLFIFSNEASIRSDHLSFSYPLRRSVLFLSRYLTSLTLLAVSFLAGLFSSLIVDYLLIRHMALFYATLGVNDYSQRVTALEFLLHDSPQFFFTKIGFLLLFVFLGIITLTNSLRYVFRWFKGFLCNLTVLAFFIAFLMLGLRHLSLKSPIGVGTETIINSAIVGVLFFAIGLFLFEKYGEV